ncbi:LysR family transcriptional regulator [Bradyrhizobium sp. BR13661]|jgi:DNA-binding transcriptional LysR family regulator|uniref:LysR family transcriptional regulator n=1 Tax=Bradyrhizobium sp. BR13661 TaxID=2940622 RepID=UPI0024769677|nr:LysR family transcriptional regulator [Bradyrhizobium sp. BR13661]MDH6261718.1 DNA-binding transcriptional LysR family regulator [Bradyrhizobium sp. BR13661]
MSQINLGPREIEAFLAVASHGSFRAAAIALGMSQPAISSRIRHAEDVLGVRLFHRTTRKVSITDHGERLRIRAEAAIAELRAVIHEFRDEARMQRGRIVIGASPATAAGVKFFSIIQQFRKRWPGIEVIVHDDLDGPPLDRLVSGEIDFAVGPARRVDERLNFEVLMQEDILLVAHESHPLSRQRVVTIADAAEYPLLTRPPQTAIWELLSDVYQTAGFPLKPAVEFHNVLSLVAMLKAGFGISFVPAGAIPLLNMDELKTRRISPTPLQRTVAIVTARGRAVQPSSAALMNALRLGYGLRKGNARAAQT